MVKALNGDFKSFNLSKDYHRLGIFDSGIGGLSIVKCLNGYLSNMQADDKPIGNNKEIIYVADSARFPYGTKTAKEIITYTEQIVRWLEQNKVDQIVFGCNTASALASERISQITHLPVLDLIDPVARYLGQLELKVGILATQATVNSHAFSRAIKHYAPSLSVTEIASTELVNIVENGDISSKETRELLTNYIDKFYSSGTQILVLSCTHFSFLKEIILELVNKDMRLLDPAELVVQMLSPAKMSLNNFPKKSHKQENVIEPTVYVTGDVDNFAKTAAKCLGYSLKNLRQLSISNLESLDLPQP